MEKKKRYIQEIADKNGCSYEDAEKIFQKIYNMSDAEVLQLMLGISALSKKEILE